MPNNPGMQNYPQQNMYNGPSQAHMPSNPHMYNNMPMNRNSNYNMYGAQNMPNQYGTFNGPVGPNQGPGSGGMNSGGHPGMDMSGPRGQGPGGQNGPVKGAQAAAQAALMAAASTSSRPHGRHSQQKMPGPQVNHAGYVPAMNMGSGGVPNSMNQLPNSHSPVPNSVGPGMPKSSNIPSMPSEALHNSNSQDSYSSQSNGPIDSSVSSSTEVQNSKLPSTQNIPPSIQNMQRDSNSSSSTLSNSSVPSSDINSAAMNIPPRSGSVDSTKEINRTSTPPCSTPNARPESHGADSNLSSLTEDSSQGDVSSSNLNEQKEADVPSMPEQGSLPPNSVKQEIPITTTATTHNSGMQDIEFESFKSTNKNV